MKTNEALFILGNDRVYELFLQGNMQDMSNFVRRFLMSAKFYGVSAEKLAELLKREVLWQDSVRQAYEQHLSRHNVAVETKQTETLNFDYHD